MAKKQYVGVDGTARNIKSLYVGVNGVARKVKKAYIGVNGIAREFLSGSAMRFVGFTNVSSNGGYGTAVASKEGSSLYLNASGTAPSGIAIDAGYELRDSSGNLYVIPAGSEITFTMRYEKYAWYNLCCLRLTNMRGVITYPAKDETVTNKTFKVTEDSTLMFLAEVGFGGNEIEYARVWVDKFILNGETLV